jgi:hypothetical protein
MEDFHRFYVPFVMSFSIEGFAYKAGFRNPKDVLPAFKRSSLMRLITAANIGVLADVPPESEKFPPT